MRECVHGVEMRHEAGERRAGGGIGVRGEAGKCARQETLQ